MKLQSKPNSHTARNVNPVILGLYLFASALPMTSVQAADRYDTSSQISMLTQAQSRSSISKELQALEEEYINDVIGSLNNQSGGPDFSRDEVYVDHLVDVMNGKTQQNQPNFADDEVYLNHLASILIK